MRVRDLERLLVANGAGAAKLDAISRRLRHSGRLPKGGRGPNAPEIGAAEAAMILLALAGSTKGAEADLRLQKLEGLPCSAERDSTLLAALAALLEDPKRLAGLTEVRVGRTTRRASFVHDAGTRLNFQRASEAGAVEKFYVEGVLPGSLLMVIAQQLQRQPSSTYVAPENPSRS